MQYKNLYKMIVKNYQTSENVILSKTGTKAWDKDEQLYTNY